MTPEQKRFRDEAKRLAGLSARERKAALDVHRRIADDTRLSSATREHARSVLDTLESLISGIMRTRKQS
jgi:hypothetical protein